MKPKTLILILAAALLAACTQTKLENDGADRQKQVSDIEDIQLKSLDEQIDSIAATLAAIDSTGSLEEGDISDLEEMESKFTATLESAKESVAKISSESGGTSDSALEAQIAEIQKRLEALDAQIEALREQIDSLKESYNHLGDIIGDLTTISYIPSGADNTATVRYRVDSLAYVPDTLSLRFDLYSEDAANTVVAQWKSALSVKAVHTETKAQAGDIVNLEVVGASASDGILTVLIWPRKLDLSFIDGYLDVQISLVISSGKKKVASGYIQLVQEEDWIFVYRRNGITYNDLQDYDTNEDGILSDEELAAITELSLWSVEESSIDWLLRKLPNLETLSVGSSSLTSLDLSNTTKLTYLRLFCETLQEIIFPDSHSLTRLDCSGCSKLENLDLSNNTNLTYINVENCNNLVSLKGVEKCEKLEELYTKNTGITELEIPNLAFLKTLSIPDGLTRLNIDNDKSLSEISDCEWLSIEDGRKLKLELWCLDIPLSFLSFAGTKISFLYSFAVDFPDISAPQLTHLKISGELEELDVSRFSALDTLECSSLGLKSLNLSKCQSLTILDCSDNNLTALDLSQCNSLTTLDCSGNSLEYIDLSNNVKLSELNIVNNPSLKTLDVSNTHITSLDCSKGGGNLTTLKISNTAALVSLNCEGQALSSIDVSACPLLETLNCGSNQLTGLNVSHNSNLTTLNCRGNQLISLDVSQNGALATLNCGDNQLTGLDVSQNVALTELDCSDNQLTGLDVSHNSKLTTLNCCGNQLTSLDVSNNTSLVTLWVSATAKLIVKKGLKPSIYQIGQYVSIDGVTGVVYQTESPHIISIDETSAIWGYDGICTGAASEDDGVVNTDKIESGSPAAQWCRSKGTEWYLPARNELKISWNNMSELNATLSSIDGTQLTYYYWSSTECYDSNNYNSVWVFTYCSDGLSSYWGIHYSKVNSYKVRAVRAL